MLNSIDNKYQLNYRKKAENSWLSSIVKLPVFDRFLRRTLLQVIARFWRARHLKRCEVSRSACKNQRTHRSSRTINCDAVRHAVVITFIISYSPSTARSDALWGKRWECLIREKMIFFRHHNFSFIVIQACMLKFWIIHVMKLIVLIIHFKSLNAIVSHHAVCLCLSFTRSQRQIYDSHIGRLSSADGRLFNRLFSRNLIDNFSAPFLRALELYIV